MIQITITAKTMNLLTLQRLGKATYMHNEFLMYFKIYLHSENPYKIHINQLYKCQQIYNKFVCVSPCLPYTMVPG